jgi:hypothetical protein
MDTVSSCGGRYGCTVFGMCAMPEEGGDVVPCLDCRGRGWRWVTCRADLAERVTSGEWPVGVRRRPCPECGGEGSVSLGGLVSGL